MSPFAGLAFHPLDGILQASFFHSLLIVLARAEHPFANETAHVLINVFGVECALLFSKEHRLLCRNFIYSTDLVTEKWYLPLSLIRCAGPALLLDSVLCANAFPYARTPIVCNWRLDCQHP